MPLVDEIDVARVGANRVVFHQSGIAVDVAAFIQSSRFDECRNVALVRRSDSKTQIKMKTRLDADVTFVERDDRGWHERGAAKLYDPARVTRLSGSRMIDPVRKLR